MPKTAPDFIPLLYPEEGYWLLKDWSLTAMFEVCPWSGEGRSPEQFGRAASALAGIIEAELFAGTTLSLCTVVLPGPDPAQIDHMRRAHKSSTLIDGKLATLDGAVHRKHYVAVNVASVSKKNKKEEFRQKFLEAKNRIRRICDTLPTMLGAIFERVIPLDSDQAFLAWKRILNRRAACGLIYPEYSEGGKVNLPEPPAEQLVTSDIMCCDDAFMYAGRRHRVYSCTLPPAVDAVAIYEAMMRVDFPCRVTFNFHIPKSRHDRERSLAVERALSRFMALGKAREHNLDKAAAIDALLREIREDASKLVDISGFVVVSGEDKDLNLYSDRLVNAFAEIEMGLIQEVVYGVQGFFCWALPGLGGGRVPESRRFVVSTKTSAHLVTLYGDFRGDAAPVMLFHNRHGSLVGFSPVSERQAKWGGMIVAPSGSGKTFLANSILYHLANLKEPPFIGIIDMALTPSYRSIVSSMGGTVLLLDADAQNTINPFEFPFPLATPPERHIAFLREVFLPSLIEAPSNIQLQFLERTLRRMYRIALSDDSHGEPKTIETSDTVPEKFWRYETWMAAREAYIGKYIESRSAADLSAAAYAHVRMMPTIHDLLETLMDPENATVDTDRQIADDLRRQLSAAFSGIRGRLFGGHTSIGLSSVHNESLVYVYFGDLVNFRDLLASAFLVVHHYIQERAIIASDEEAAVFERVFGPEKILAAKSRKKVFLLDEVHNLGFSPYCMQQIERNYRQGRTLGLSTIAITQGLREIAENASGSAMIENAALTILLRHSTPEAPNEVAVGYVSEKLGLSAKMGQLLRGLERTDTHSDMIIMSEGIGAGVARYAPTAMERWIGTTHNLESQVRADLVTALVAKGYLAGEALGVVVKLLAELYPRGLARSGDSPQTAKQKVLALTR